MGSRSCWRCRTSLASRPGPPARCDLSFGRFMEAADERRGTLQLAVALDLLQLNTRLRAERVLESCREPRLHVSAPLTTKLSALDRRYVLTASILIGPEGRLVRPIDCRAGRQGVRLKSEPRHARASTNPCPRAFQLIRSCRAWRRWRSFWRGSRRGCRESSCKDRPVASAAAGGPARCDGRDRRLHRLDGLRASAWTRRRRRPGGVNATRSIGDSRSYQPQSASKKTSRFRFEISLWMNWRKKPLAKFSCAPELQAAPGSQWAAYIVDAACAFCTSNRGSTSARSTSNEDSIWRFIARCRWAARASSSSAADRSQPTMMNLRDHFDLMNAAAGRSLRIADSPAAEAHRGAFTPLKLAALCQSAEKPSRGRAVRDHGSGGKLSGRRPTG